MSIHYGVIPPFYFRHKKARAGRAGNQGAAHLKQAEDVKGHISEPSAQPLRGHLTTRQALDLS